MGKSVKIWLITAACLILVGCMIFMCVMSILNWDFIKLSTNEFTTNTHEIVESYNNISMVTNTADILFVTCEGENSLVECFEQENLIHSVKVKDGTLVIEVNDNRKWRDYIGINFATPKITVHIPKDKITDYAIISGEVKIETSTGKISVSDIICENDVSVNVSTGRVNLTNVKCKNLISSGNTGDITLENVIATEKFIIERSTGGVKLNMCDANEIFIQTDTGDVDVNLLTDKVFVAHTDTGRVDVPKTVTGGRCEITTDTGNIYADIGR